MPRLGRPIADVAGRRDVACATRPMLMIVISDNSATNMCIDLVGLDESIATMSELGFATRRCSCGSAIARQGSTRARCPSRPPARWCGCMTLIAEHACVSPEASEDMLRIMRRSDYRHELSLELPWNEMNMLGDDPKTGGWQRRAGRS